MKVHRRAFLHLGAGTAALPIISRVASAQAYPTRPITMIVPIAAGSSSDVVGRLVAERMGTVLGQPLIIENVPGADGRIGVGRVARARPDGYTIEFGFLSANVLNGAFYSLPYDLLDDLTPISPVVAFPTVLYATASLPVTDLKELIAWLRANPNKASAGVTTVSYRMVTALFQKGTVTAKPAEAGKLPEAHGRSGFSFFFLLRNARKCLGEPSGSFPRGSPAGIAAVGKKA